MKTLAALFLACLLAVPPAISADLSAFQPFLGQWSGSGRLWGNPANIVLSWKRVLAERFVSLDFDVTDAKTGKSTFAGHAMYPTGAGTWHDTNGDVYAIRWTAEPGAIHANWGQPDSPRGKSVYRIVDSETIEVVDSVRNKDGSFREFARYAAHRAKP